MLTILFLMFKIFVIRVCFEIRFSDFEFILANLRISQLLLTGPKGTGFKR